MALPDNVKEFVAKIENQGAARWLLVVVGAIILIRLRLILFAAALPVMAYWHYSNQAEAEDAPDGAEGEAEGTSRAAPEAKSAETSKPDLGTRASKSSPWGDDEDDDPFLNDLGNDLRPAKGKASGAAGGIDPYDQSFWGESGARGQGSKSFGGDSPARQGAGNTGGASRGSPLRFADDDDDLGFVPKTGVSASKPGSLTGGGGGFLGPGGGSRGGTSGTNSASGGGIGGGSKAKLGSDDEDPLADFGGLGGGLGAGLGSGLGGGLGGGGGLDGMSGGGRDKKPGGGGLDDFDFLGGLGGLGGGLGSGGGGMDFLGSLGGGGMDDDMDFLGGGGGGRGKGKGKKGGGKDPMAPREPDPKQIFVANVGDLSDDQIRSFFEEVGDVDRLKVLQNPDGSSKGVCFVTFATLEQAQKALTLHGTNLEGRNLVIRLAHGGNKGEKGDKGGGGKGFGRDRDREMDRDRGFDRDRSFDRDRPPRDQDDGPLDLGGSARFGAAFGDRGGDRDRGGGKGFGGRGKGPGGGPRRNDRNEMDEILEEQLADQDGPLRATDFDFSARRFLSELRNRDRTDDTQRFKEAMEMVLKYTSSKDRASVRKWPAYVFTLLQKFDPTLSEELRDRDAERKREKGGGGFGGSRDFGGGRDRDRDRRDPFDD